MNLGAARTAQSRIVRARAGTKRDARACWYRIAKAGANGKYVVRIEGDIGVDRDEKGNVIGVSAGTFIKQIRAIRDLKSLTATIFSAGGNVFDGIQIYNFLRELSKSGIPVTIRIGALAASIASVIAMAGDTVEIHAESSFMIHDPWVSIDGNAADLRKQALMLDKLRSTMMSAYARKNPGLALAELEKMLLAETWFTGAEAVEAGFADVLISESIDSEALAHAGAIVKAMAGPRRKPKAKAEGDDDQDQDKDANADGDGDDQDKDANADADGDDDKDQDANADADLDSIAAALGAIAETLQEVLDAVTGASADGDDDEDPNADADGDDDEDKDANTDDEDSDEDKEEQAKARARARARARRGVRAGARKPVDTGSKAYAALKKIAKANGQLGAFVTYVAAGASLSKLQAKFLDGESDASTRIQATSAGSRGGKAVRLDADSYYASLNGGGKSKKKDH